MQFERTYTIPLRKGTLKVPRKRRSKKAISVLKEFVSKHAKSTEVVIGERLNEAIWTNGITNPPSFVTVTMRKEDDGKVFVNLVGHPVKPQ